MSVSIRCSEATNKCGSIKSVREPDKASEPTSIAGDASGGVDHRRRRSSSTIIGEETLSWAYQKKSTGGGEVPKG